ncbi:MAG: DUF1844 domain-containing protein [Candidatus Marinimicrobia bacterium]|nr:DUF1844 domain-containing protein [Candidatus Neomarinimicrobiota bacterium]
MTYDNTDKHTQLFLGLVTSLSTQAWIQLGKLKNPMTDKLERDIEAASVTIDMLDMLKVKMTGNLSEEEDRLLSSTVSDLKINYVEERDKPEPEEEEPAVEKKEKEGEDSKNKSE